jgi:hypothetical protein
LLFRLLNLIGVTVSEDPTPSTRSEEAKRGITIGILVVVLLCLSLFFLWRHYGGGAGVASSDTHTGASITR